MGPFMILTIIWMAAISAELIQRPFLRNPSTHILFPVGFLILAAALVALNLCNLYEGMRVHGPADPFLITQDGLVFARALIVLATAAVLSFFTTLFILLWRARGRTVCDERQVCNRDDPE